MHGDWLWSWWLTGLLVLAIPIIQIPWSLAANSKNQVSNAVAKRTKMLWQRIGHYSQNLGAFAFSSDAKIQFSCGNQNKSQDDHVEIRIDQHGNSQSTFSNANTTLRFIQKQSTIWLAYGTGPMRRKSSRDMDTAALLTQAVHAPAMHLVLIGRHANESSELLTKLYDGRRVTKICYTPLFTADKTTPSIQRTWSLAQLDTAMLRISPLPTWVSKHRPIDFKAELWIDEKAALVLAADISAHLVIAENNADSDIQVTTKFHSNIHHIGNISPINKPLSAIEEYQRIQHTNPAALLHDYLTNTHNLRK